ncbi:Prolow-density lipoprotein receptor-related protein 1 [Thelohanellus kitauei]|uniref:Prolow-density lipoprotein receptor-related protein 1 n=1 Tax=Thelohanellus kitauei TaxID=669202 RepID=A0A0C2J3Q2_THEKT|nr:Prolow-density lipoprotein receptor-related protein 1 [Thelohanellus kitauei]
MAHDSCNPHELHLDTNTASNDLCIENEWTNSLLLFKSKNLYISQITSNGAYFRKQVALEVNLYAKVVVSAPIAFDYSKELIYNFLGKYITQFKISGNYQALLYFKNDTMVAMAHDSVFQVIIFLNGRKQLRVLSLITHFEYVVSYDVTHFTYSPHHKLISFVVSRKSFCYCKILEKPQCTQHIFDILQFTIDLPFHRVYFLTSKNVLVIKTFSITPTNLKTLQDIPNVIDFAPYDDNLYLLEEQKLMYRNVKLENKSVVLIKDSYVRLFLHRETLKSFKHTCESSNCQFMCRQASNDGVTCGCPVYSKQVDNRCECLPDHPDCLLPHCSGFYCKNSKCLLNNVMCNGVDDCGDGSDEAKCTVKCLPTSHRCRNECIPKQTVCDTVHFEIELEIKAKKLRGVHIFLIILLCLVVPYPLYRFIRLCYRRLYRRRLRLKFWSQSNFQIPEFEMLIEPEVNSMAYVGMY